jgi:DNA-binding Lrp family transcriptional regulator
VLQAFMLVTVSMGDAQAVVLALRVIDGVRAAEIVTGPYDIVVDMEAVDVDVLGTLVQERVQRVPGVVRTLTCPVFHL